MARIPGVLSSAKLLKLLNNFGKAYLDKSLLPGLLPVLENFSLHYSHYSKDPHLVSKYREGLSQLLSYPSLKPILAPVVPEALKPSLESIEVATPASHPGEIYHTFTGLSAVDATAPIDLSDYNYSYTERTLLVFIDTVCRERMIYKDHINEMQTVFLWSMEQLDVHAVCKGFEIMAKENVFITTNLLQAIQSKLLSTSSPISNSLFARFLKSFRAREPYLRVPSSFLHRLSSKLLQQDIHFPGNFLYHATANLFFIPEFYSKLSRMWMTQSVDDDDFLDGYLGIITSPFTSKAELDWGRDQLLSKIDSISSSELSEILYRLMSINHYEEGTWRTLCHAIVERGLQGYLIKKMSFVFEGLATDNPPFAKALLDEYQNIHQYGKLLSAKKFNQTLVSDTESIMTAEIKKCGYSPVLENVEMMMYNVDVSIPSLSLAVEFIGSPIHVSQADGSLDIHLQRKIRHLLKTNISVLLVFSVDAETFIEKFKAAVEIIRRAEKAILVTLSAPDIAVQFVKVSSRVE